MFNPQRSQDTYIQPLTTSQLQSSTSGSSFGSIFGSPSQGNPGTGAGGSAWGSMASSSSLNVGSNAGTKELQRSQYQSGYLMVCPYVHFKTPIDASLSSQACKIKCVFHIPHLV
jgi:hypothetical protein